MCGFGFGSFIFSFITTAIVNPNDVKKVNEYYSDDIAKNVPKMFSKIALIWSFLALISILNVKRKP